MQFGRSFVETLLASKVDGTALTAAAAATALTPAAKPTFDAGFFTQGKSLLILAAGRISVVVTTPGTARFDIRLGGTVVFDSQAIALDPVAYSNVGWFMAILMTCRVDGSTGNFMGQGIFTSPILAGNPATPPKGSLTALLPWNTAPAVGGNFDTTTSQQMDMFFTQTVATGSMTCHMFVPITLN